MGVSLKRSEMNEDGGRSNETYSPRNFILSGVEGSYLCTFKFKSSTGRNLNHPAFGTKIFPIDTSISLLLFDIDAAEETQPVGTKVARERASGQEFFVFCSHRDVSVKKGSHISPITLLPHSIHSI